MLQKKVNLFKGKLLYSDKWIEGNLVISQNKKPYILPSEIIEPDGHHLIIDSDNHFEVYEKSVSQYINSQDKNGKLVFEGDYDDVGNVVVWCSECNSFEFAQFDIETKELFEDCHRCEGNYTFLEHIDDFEIIGNVADLILS